MSETNTEMRVQNPFRRDAIGRRIQDLGGCYIAAKLGRLILKGSEEKPENIAKLEAKIAELEELGNNADAALEAEEKLPKLALRHWQTYITPKTKVAKRSVLFPGNVGDPDLRAIWDSWGFSWDGGEGDSQKPDRFGKWQSEHVQLYRNGKHALVTQTFNKISPQGT